MDREEKILVGVYLAAAASCTIVFAIAVEREYAVDNFQGDATIGPSYLYSTWAALKLCLATSSLGFISLIYSILCRLKKNPVPPGWRVKYWDVVVPIVMITILWFAAFVTMAAFVNQGLYCTANQEDCRPLLDWAKQRFNALAAFSCFAFLAWSYLTYDTFQKQIQYAKKERRDRADKASAAASVT